MYNSRSFKTNDETGEFEINIDDFKIISIGHRPEDVYQFKIRLDEIEAEFAATGIISTDSAGNSVGFSWKADFIKSPQLDELIASIEEKRVIRLQISRRIELFLKSYCPDIVTYPLKHYSESERFERWSRKDQ